MARRASFAVVLTALLALLSGCGGGDAAADAGAPAPTSAPAPQLPAAAKQALDVADTLELLQLDPDTRDREAGFHGHKVVRRVKLAAAPRRRVVEAFARGVAEDPGSPPACFNPRHGLRATRGGVAHDFVICFECRQVELYEGAELTEKVFTSRSPEPVFQAALADAPAD